MTPIKFDVEGARRANFTDQQIADTLANAAKFDAAAARKAGFTDQQIIERLAAPQPMATPTGVRPAGDNLGKMELPGVGETLLIGAGRTFDRLVKGAKQVKNAVTGDKAAAAALDAEAKADDEVYKRLQKERPFATGIGEALPSMVVPIGATASVPTTLAKLAAVPMAIEAASYGTAAERATNAGVAGAGSVVGGYVVPTAIKSLVNAGKNTLRGFAGNVTPEAMELYRKAQQYGVPVNVAQLGDSKFTKTLASTLEQLPLTGAAKSHATQGEAYNRAISKTFGDDVPKITQEVYAKNRARLGQTFEDLSMRNTLNLDDTLMTRLDTVMNEVRQFGDPSTVKAVEGAIDRLLSQSNATARGKQTIIEVPGAAYQSLDTALGKIIKGGGEKSVYLKTVRDALRDGMDRSISAADKEAWDTARGQYRNLKAIRDIVARDGATGDIPPLQLMAALNKDEIGKEAMAKGMRGELGDLARIGKQFVRDPIANSGTMQRAVALGVLGGGGIAFGIDPVTGGSILLGAATTGRAINKALNSPKVVESLARPPLTLADIIKQNPAMLTQILGSGAGQATADMVRN